MPKLSNEQFWKLYEKLPQELKDALFSEETGNNISEICQRNEIEDNLGEVVDLVGQVLAGVLPPEDFQKTLEADLKIKKDAAKKVNQEINRFIFYPVKPALEQLYKVGAAASLAEGPTTPASQKNIQPAEEKSPIQERGKSSSPVKEDTYRELIE